MKISPSRPFIEDGRGRLSDKGNSTPKVQRHEKTSSAQGWKGRMCAGKRWERWLEKENIKGAQAEAV